MYGAFMPQESATEPDLIPMREATERAGVTEHTLRRWVRNGRLIKYKKPIGGGPGRPSVFFDRAELDRLTKPVAG